MDKRTVGFIPAFDLDKHIDAGFATLCAAGRIFIRGGDRG